VALPDQEVRQRSAPAPGAENGDPGHDGRLAGSPPSADPGLSAALAPRPKRFSVPRASRCRFARCFHTRKAASAVSIARTPPRAPSSTNAAIGKSAADTTLPSETYPVSHTSAPQTTSETTSAFGARARTTPEAVATPFPPLKLTNTENTCPTTAATPQ